MKHTSLFARSLLSTATAVAVACLLVTTAQAQSAGTLMATLGAGQVKPDVTSGNLSAPSFSGSQADVKADTQPLGGLTYMVTDNVAITVPLSLGYTLDITGAGAIAGVGKIGQVKAVPVTLLAQYRLFSAGSSFRPYVGIGPTYAKFYKARSTAALTGLTGGSPANPTTLSVDSKFSATLQVGASYQFTQRLFIDASVSKLPLKTRTTLSTGQTLDIKLDPLITTVGLGYRF